jgi:hypothetical protein
MKRVRVGAQPSGSRIVIDFTKHAVQKGYDVPATLYTDEEKRDAARFPSRIPLSFVRRDLVDEFGLVQAEVIAIEACAIRLPALPQIKTRLQRVTRISGLN